MSGNNALDLQQHILSSLGFAVKVAWLDAMLPQLESAHGVGFQQMPRDQQLQLILEQLLVADFRMAGAGGHLPANINDQHKHQLQGKYMLQLNEVVNIAAGFRERYRDQGAHRCLKLHLTDGVQDVVAIEYRFTPLLAVLAPAGLKLLIVNPEVRRGMLLLQPENVVVLGGMVDELEVARQALLQHVNKPADHCAQRCSCEQIYQQAAQAAWANAGQQQQPAQQASAVTHPADAAGHQPHHQHQQQQQQRQPNGQQQQHQQQQQPQQQWQPPILQQAVAVQQPEHQQWQNQAIADSMAHPDPESVWQQRQPQQQQRQQQQQQQQPHRPGLMLPPLHPPPRRTPTGAANPLYQQQQLAAAADRLQNSGQLPIGVDAPPGGGGDGDVVLDPPDDFEFLDDLDHTEVDVQLLEAAETPPNTAAAAAAGSNQFYLHSIAAVVAGGRDATEQQQQLLGRRPQSYPAVAAAAVEGGFRSTAADDANDDHAQCSDSDDGVEIIEDQHAAGENRLGARQQGRLTSQQQQQCQHDALHDAADICDVDSDMDLDRALDRQLEEFHSVHKQTSKNSQPAAGGGSGLLQVAEVHHRHQQQQQQQQPLQQQSDDMDWDEEEQQQQQQQQQPVLQRRHKRAAQVSADSEDEASDDEHPGRGDKQQWQQHQQQSMQDSCRQLLGAAAACDGVASEKALQANPTYTPPGSIAVQLEHTASHKKPSPNRPAAATAVVVAAVSPAPVMADADHRAVIAAGVHGCWSAAEDAGMAANPGGSGGGLVLSSRRVLSVSQMKRSMQMSQLQQSQQQEVQQKLMEPWKPQRHQKPAVLPTHTVVGVSHQQQKQQQQQQHGSADLQYGDTHSKVPSPVTMPSSHAGVGKPVARSAGAAAAAARPGVMSAAVLADGQHQQVVSGGTGSKGQGSAGSSGGSRRVSGGSVNPLVFERSDPLKIRRSSVSTAAAAAGAMTPGAGNGAGASNCAGGVAAAIAGQQIEASCSSKPAMDQLFDNLLQALDCADDSDLGMGTITTCAGVATPAAAVAPLPQGAVPHSVTVGVCKVTNCSSGVVIAAAAASELRQTGGGSGTARKQGGSAAGSGSKSGAGSGGSRRAGSDIRAVFARANEFVAAGALPVKQNRKMHNTTQQQQGLVLGSKGSIAAAAEVGLNMFDDNDDIGQQLEQLDDDNW